MGFPFLTDFIQKMDPRNRFFFVSAVGMFAYILGLFLPYSRQFILLDLLMLTFISSLEVFVHHIMQAHDAPLLMTIPLIILFVVQYVLVNFVHGLFIGPVPIGGVIRFYTS
jgi:hypothetical protein